MSTPTHTLDRSVHSPEVLRLVEQLLDRFEDAYRSGRTPDLAVFLDEAPATVRGEVFRELLLLEMSYRAPADIAAAELVYRERFPDFYEQIAAVFRGSVATLAFTNHAPPPPSTSAAVGAERYELRGELARGGMGIVYDGWDRVLERPVALKVLTDRAGSGSLATRFVAEARITGQLQHPSIPAVHDLGVLPDGRPFLAMKRIKGETLQTLLQERERLNVLAVFEGICQAVGYAHAHGVIHRDLKPANVMVGSFGEVQVMDWGLAKVLTQTPNSAGEATELETTAPTEVRSRREADEATRAGSVLGTPAYMPPEQAIGAVDQIDRRSDVFGLGAILCALLTGKPPYLAADAESTRQLAARAKLDDAKQRLANCGAEPELVALCQRCMAPEKNDRPADAGAVASAVAELRAAAEQRAKQAEMERAQAVVRAAEQLKRRRVWWLAGSLMTTVGVVGVSGVTLWRLREADARVTEEQIRITRAADAQGELLAQAEHWLAEGDSDRALPYLKQAERQATEAGASHSERLARAQAGFKLLRELESVDAFRYTPVESKLPSAKEVVERWARVFEGIGIIPGTTPVAEASERLRSSPVRKSLLAALDVWLMRGDGGEPVRTLLAAADPDPFRDNVRQLSAGRNSVGFAAILERPDWEKQPTGFITACAASPLVPSNLQRRLLERVVAGQPSDFSVLMQLGGTYPINTPDSAGERIRWYQAAVASRPSNVAAYNNLGNALDAKGARASAIACYKEAIRIAPNVSLSHYNLGVVLKDHGDLDGAIACYQEAIRLDPKYANAHINLGWILQGKGKLDEAISCFKEAIRLDPKLALAHNNLGWTLEQKGDFEGAVACYKEALRRDTKQPHALVNLPKAERLRELQQHLPEILAGKAEPKSSSEYLDFLNFCLHPSQQRFLEAVRLYERAFAAHPKLASDLEMLLRFYAASYALKAARGDGVAAPSEAKERASLRAKALAWLRADLDQWTKAVQANVLTPQQFLGKLSHLRDDSALSDSRPGAKRDGWTEAESQACDQFWTDIQSALTMATLRGYEEAIRLDPDKTPARTYNEAAWILATGPGDLRDGAKAVEYATKTCEFRKWQSSHFLDTLGAAYAQAGNFDKAIEYADKALAFPAFEKSHGAQVRQQLELYRQKKALPPQKPVRETPEDKPKEKPKS